MALPFSSSPVSVSSAPLSSAPPTTALLISISEASSLIWIVCVSASAEAFLLISVDFVTVPSSLTV